MSGIYAKTLEDKKWANQNKKVQKVIILLFCRLGISGREVFYGRQGTFFQCFKRPSEKIPAKQF